MVIILDPLWTVLVAWRWGEGYWLCVLPFTPSFLSWGSLMRGMNTIIGIIFTDRWTSLIFLMTSKSRTPLVNSVWVQSVATKSPWSFLLSPVQSILEHAHGPAANQPHWALTQTPEHCAGVLGGSHPCCAQGRPGGLPCVTGKESSSRPWEHKPFHTWPQTGKHGPKGHRAPWMTAWINPPTNSS